MTDTNELQAKLKLLSDAYAAQLPEKFRQIEQACEQLPRDNWDEEGFQALYRMVHSLTGSGKTFGFALLSDVAHNLEEYLRQIAQAKMALDKEQCSRIQVWLGELRQVSMQKEVPGQDGWASITSPTQT